MSKNVPALIEDPPESELGPAMRALDDRRRRFVWALMDQGISEYKRAAMAAGISEPNYARTWGQTTAHSPKVQAAILEEARKRLAAASIMGASVLIKIAEDATAAPRDRLKAVGMLFDRVGMHAKTEQIITERPLTPEEMLARIKLLSEKYGIDVSSVIAPAVDAEFVEVKPEPRNILADATREAEAKAEAKAEAELEEMLKT